MKHSTGTLQIGDGQTLFTQKWLPDGQPKAAVLILHGLAEHSGRYQHVAEAFVSSGYAVYSFDGRGHGQSSGSNAYFESMDHYLGDVDLMLEQMVQQNSGIPHFLVGHSMGGGIATLFTITRQPRLNGLVLSGPLIQQNDDAPALLSALAPILGKWLPKVPALKIESDTVSRDPAVVEAYENDELNFTGTIPARTPANLIDMMSQIAAKSSTIKLPILIMHGSEDRLVQPQGSKVLYANVSSADKTLKIYEGLYHEIFNEPEKEEVLQDTITWCDAHM